METNKDPLDKIFVEKFPKEVYDKIDKEKKELELSREKIEITLGNFNKLRKGCRELKELKNHKESYEILVYKAIEIAKQEYNLFDKKFTKMSDSQKIKALHHILDESEKRIKKFYKKPSPEKELKK